MAWKDTEFVKDLGKAIRLFDRRRITELCDLLVEHIRSSPIPYSKRRAERILDKLRSHRLFDPVRQIADALIQTEQDTPLIRRFYAQSLLDRNDITAAISFLRVSVNQTRPKSHPDETAQMLGLLGRAYKQLYTTSRKLTPYQNLLSQQQRYLQEALHQYIAAYETTDKEGVDTVRRHSPTVADTLQLDLWHRINTVALLCRAKRDGWNPNLFREEEPLHTRPMARSILCAIRKRHRRRKAGAWDYANAAEACLALGDYKTALEWIERHYVKHEDTDAFAIASTLRQFEELWQLDIRQKPQAVILTLLRKALLEREGGQLRMSCDDSSNILGPSRRAMAQITTSSGQLIGAGILVRGGDMFPRFGNEKLILTNTHLVSQEPEEQAGGAYSIEDVRVRFDALKTDYTYDVAAIEWSSPSGRLNATLLRLKQHGARNIPIPPCPIRHRKIPPTGKDKIYVMGYPSNDQQYPFASRTTLIRRGTQRQLDHLYYRTPIEGLIPGGIVLSSTGKLIALHCAEASRVRTKPLAPSVERTRTVSRPEHFVANHAVSIDNIRNKLQHWGETDFSRVMIHRTRELEGIFCWIPRNEYDNLIGSTVQCEHAKRFYPGGMEIEFSKAALRKYGIILRHVNFDRIQKTYDTFVKTRNPRYGAVPFDTFAPQWRSRLGHSAVRFAERQQ